MERPPLEYQEYRDALAATLQETPKSDRSKILVTHKLQPEYRSANSEHSLASEEHRDTKQLTELVASAGNFNHLCDLLRETSVFAYNEHSGVDHSEHLLKRMEMARELHCATILPETGGLRERVGQFLETEGIPLEQNIDPEQYQGFLQHRFPQYSFSPEELAALCEKLPANVFGSLDAGLEESIVLLNALPNAATKYSCAGHTDDRENVPSATRGYLSIDTTDATLADYLGDITRDAKSFRVTQEKTPPATTRLRFEKRVPEDWIKAHEKRSPPELFEESKQQLSEILGKEILSYAHPNQEFFHAILQLQARYLSTHKEAATIPYAPNSRLLTNVKNCLFETLAEKEYGEYFFTEESEQEKKQYLQNLASTIALYREANMAFIDTRNAISSHTPTPKNYSDLSPLPEGSLAEVAEHASSTPTTTQEQQDLDRHHIIENLSTLEHPATEEERERIVSADKKVNAVMERYGIPSHDIDPALVHIVPKHHLPHDHAFFSRENNAMVFAEPLTEFALIHELFHYKGVNWLPVPLTEAIIERLTNEAENSTDETLSGGAVFSGIYTYPRERETLDLFIKKIQERAPEGRTTPAKTFAFFAKAHLSGDDWSVKFLDDLFGAGTLEKLDALDESSEAFQAFVDQLV